MTKNMKIRNVPLIIMSMLVISTILYTATTIRPASADGTAMLFVEPPETILTNANVGTLFNVSVTLANVTGVAGVQWNLGWNASLLSCTSITENLFATVTPDASKDNIWKIQLKKDNIGGNADYAITYQDLDLAQADGYAPINVTTSEFTQGKIVTAIMTFNVTQVPPLNSYYDCYFTFNTVKVGDMFAGQLVVANQTGYYRIYGPPETTDTQISYEGTNYTVTTATNASLVPDSMEFAKLNDSSYKLDFNLTGTEGATAYVNVTIPKALMSVVSDEWVVAVNGEEVTPTVTSDTTNWYLYITTTLSTKNIEIWGTVPEFTMLLIPLLMAATLVAVGLRRRKQL